MTEQAIQKQILNYLKHNNWFAYKTIMGNRAGIPDIYALHNGRHIWIEVKRANGRVSKIQNYVHDEMEKQGAEVYVVKSLAELIEILKEKL